MAPSPKITKDRIKNAFIKLLNTNPLESITIKQVCTTAEISRTSFYYHYESLDEVLKEMFDETFDIAFKSKNWDFQYLYSRNFIEDIVTFFDENSTLLLALAKWELIPYVSHKKAKLLNQEIQNHMSYKSPNYANYILIYLMGKYFIICSQWIKNGKPESKEDIITLLSLLNQFEHG